MAFTRYNPGERCKREIASPAGIHITARAVSVLKRMSEYSCLLWSSGYLGWETEDPGVQMLQSRTG